MTSPPAAPARPRLLLNAATSVFDQAWLSLLNLALGLILIRLTTKEAYSTYAQLFVAGILAASIAEAVITGPLTTLASSRPEDERATMIAHLDRFQRWLSTGVAVLFGLSCVGVALWVEIAQPLWLGLAFAFYVKTNASREYRRSILFIETRPQRVLWLDLRYGLTALVLTSLLIWAEWVPIPAVFATLGAANVIAMLGMPRHPTPAAEAVTDFRKAVRESWKRGRLALPGAILAWIINYSYLFLTAAWLGAAVAADLNASRLLLVPMSLTVLAWSRVARPLIGRMLAANDRAGLNRLLLGSVLGIEALTLAYVALLWLTLPWLQHHVLGEKYANVQPLMLAWGAYFAINAARWIGNAVLMSADRFGWSLMVDVVSLTLMLSSINILLPRFGSMGAIMSLTLVESVGLILYWTAFRYSQRRPAAT